MTLPGFEYPHQLQPGCWQERACSHILEDVEDEATEEDEGPGWDLYGYDDDQALEEFSLECAFGPDE